jgi:hypothetical protein
VHEHARDGWRLVQIFAPGVAAFGAAKYYELIFERERAEDATASIGTSRGGSVVQPGHEVAAGRSSGHGDCSRKITSVVHDWDMFCMSTQLGLFPAPGLVPASAVGQRFCP